MRMYSHRPLLVCVKQHWSWVEVLLIWKLPNRLTVGDYALICWGLIIVCVKDPVAVRDFGAQYNWKEQPSALICIRVPFREIWLLNSWAGKLLKCKCVLSFANYSLQWGFPFTDTVQVGRGCSYIKQWCGNTIRSRYLLCSLSNACFSFQILCAGDRPERRNDRVAQLQVILCDVRSGHCFHQFREGTVHPSRTRSLENIET